MQKQFSAHSLEEAYELAANKFKTSIIDLNVKVIQKPKSGFFGFFKKEAIILASLIEVIDEQQPSTTLIDSKQIIIDDIKIKIDKLFSHLCFDIDDIDVKFYDDTTVLVEFTGKDAPLLIGKEGYRYKALSYLLFNWINDKYSISIRLEIASFLKSQEQSIALYLEPLIDDIKNGKMIKTKPLDGILVHIALDILRETFPNKYVAIKTNIKGDKYVLVNEYKS